MKLCHLCYVFPRCVLCNPGTGIPSCYVLPRVGWEVATWVTGDWMVVEAEPVRKQLAIPFPTYSILFNSTKQCSIPAQPCCTLADHILALTIQKAASKRPNSSPEQSTPPPYPMLSNRLNMPLISHTIPHNCGSGRRQDWQGYARRNFRVGR